MTGIRTELAFETPPTCPVADASVRIDGAVTSVTWDGGADGEVTEQFTAPGEVDAAEFEQVFDYGNQQVYEFEREPDSPCICEHIQQTLAPVTSVHARDGDLHVTLHTSDMAQLRGLLTDLQEEFGSVSMEYLVQSRQGSDKPDLVPVDLDRLTDRQRDVIETAYGMGYFEYPRGANASEVAEALGIKPSTLAEHLAAAQSKLFEELLDE
ncbi:MAG: helix-turn-helix domain-containing protein [Haloarculaceae archaeon]